MLMMRLVMKLLLGLGLEAMESEEAVVGLKLLFCFCSSAWLCYIAWRCNESLASRSSPPSGFE